MVLPRQQVDECAPHQDMILIIYYNLIIESACLLLGDVRPTEFNSSSL